MVLPPLERRAGPVAADLPLLALLEHPVIVAQGHNVEPAAGAGHIVTEMPPGGHRFVVLARQRNVFPLAVAATPALLTQFLVDAAQRIALLHPPEDGIGPEALPGADAFGRQASGGAAQERIDDVVRCLGHEPGSSIGCAE